MRSRLRAAIWLSLVLSGGGGCALIWSYGTFQDQPAGSGGSGGRPGTGTGTGGASPKANSEACTLGSECTSGYCEPAEQVDGGSDVGSDAGGDAASDGGDAGSDGGSTASVCCASACGSCQTCSADGAACQAVPKGTPGPGCAGGMVCDGLSNCVVPNGGACPTDAGAAPDAGGCLSGNCVGVVCCVTACTPCQACATDGASCVDLAAGTVDPACPAGTVCDGAGDCVGEGQ
jgi:hypothetical protein